MKAQQLKNSVLQLAVQGKLVPQDPNDEPASVLLERIRAEKQRLVSDGKIKKDKNESVICRVPKDGGSDTNNLPYAFHERTADGTVRDITDELPFDVPETWGWVRLGEACSSISDGDHQPPHKLHTEYLFSLFPMYNRDSLIGAALVMCRKITTTTFKHSGKQILMIFFSRSQVHTGYHYS